MTNAPVLDLFAPLSHKQTLSPDATTAGSSLAPTWVPRSEQRRLDAYRVRAAYALNVARFLARTELVVNRDDDGVSLRILQQAEPVEDRREYGDAALLIDRIVAGVLGDNFEIVVDGADADLPDEPELPDEPQPPAGDANEIARRVFAIRQGRWADTVTSIVDRWEADWRAQPMLQARQEWLRAWADVEQVAAKIIEGEGDTVGLGDGVYTIALSAAKRRPVVDVYDPGFYFPVRTDTTRDYPTKVHLAWEYEVDNPDGSVTRWVRRKTWELVPIPPALDGQLRTISAGDTRVTERLASAADIDDGRAQPGQLVRDYPWNVDDDGQPVVSNVTCVFSDASFPFKDLAARRVDDFDESRARFETTDDGQTANRVDLWCDFLPVVHIPNTPAHRDHFGQSVLDLVMQVLDDIQIGDTDIQDAAALAAGPAIALSGDKRATDTTVKPGTVYNVGANGRMDVLDLSKGLDSLLARLDSLLERLSVNGRVPAEVLGRTRKDGNAATSGFHELLRSGPFAQLIEKLRLTRDPKYRLLLKMAQRFGQLAGWLPPGVNPPARLAFGSFLPSDRADVVAQVSTLLAARAISTQTAVATLVDAGFAVDDARGEVQRIRYEHAENAKAIADATASEQAAADWLGVELTATTGPVVEPPTPVLPPTPPPEGG